MTAADVVTADGRARTVDADHDPDLFWALRGGGAGFAAVTSWTFTVRPAPTIARFFLQWPLSAAPDVLAAWQQWIAAAPPELWSTCKLLADPGSGTKVTVSGTWTGNGAVADRLAPLLAGVPAPTGRSTSTAAYGPTMSSEAGCSGLDTATCLARAYAAPERQPFAATSSIVTAALPAAGIAAAVSAVAAAADMADLVEGGVSFDSLGGAVAEVDPSATAFPWRTASASVQYTATWSADAPALDPAPFDAFVRGERAALTPWLGTSAYVNYADPSITDFGTAYWGPNLPRLQQIRRSYDPDGLFGFPQAVPV